tara:strand:+ start:1537 stop:2178 length:642 start_codon:yes stop_codon:yes gene_type:complete
MRYVISTIVLLISLNAQASLISIDLSTPDDGLLTLDTQSNLEWLDFSETAGMFAALVLADVGGWMSQGFRYATRQEIEDMLLGSAGFISLNNVATLHEAPAAAFNALFNTAGTTCFDLIACAIYLTPAENRIDLLNIQSDGPNSTARQFLDYGNLIWRNTGYGSALVRTSNVPLPATIWLFVSALLGLLSISRKNEWRKTRRLVKHPITRLSA